MSLSAVMAETTLKVGVAPNGEDSVTLAKVWIPFLEEVEKRSGVDLRFATAPDLLEFNRRVSQGEYDLIVTNQYLYTIFSKKHNLTYLAELSRDGKNTAVALITPQTITKLSALNGSLIAIKQHEDPVHIRALDTLLSQNSVTAVRDSLPSYQKIFESVGEQLHMAGLVPVNELDKLKQPYNVLWRTENKIVSIISAPAKVEKAKLEKVLASLNNFMKTATAVTRTPEIKVVSVHQFEIQTR